MMLKSMMMTGIRWYQRFVSPRKGFGCAYRLVYGGSGCSGVGLRLIRRYGVVVGWRLLRRRLARCRGAYHELKQLKIQNNHRVGMGRYQRGYCDVPCDLPCDVPDSLYDLPCESCADCGWGVFPSEDASPKKKRI